MQVNHRKSPWLTGHFVMDDLPLKQKSARSSILIFMSAKKTTKKNILKHSRDVHAM